MLKGIMFCEHTSNSEYQNCTSVFLDIQSHDYDEQMTQNYYLGDTSISSIFFCLKAAGPLRIN